MTNKHRFKLGKLIRDRLPDIMRTNRITVFERVMGEDEYVKRLKDKLLEEAQEVFHARGPVELKEELADVLEVIHALSQVHGLLFDEIETARRRKKEEKGGFEARVYSEAIEIDANHQHLGYFQTRPDQYPEL